MRIISGSARGTRLSTISGREIRPTPDRVREAIFSILLSRIGTFQGCRVLDLYSGTGAMAIEALSRGAAAAWLVDNGDQAGRIIPANLSACRMTDRATFLRTSVNSSLSRLVATGPYDVIFLDPPYHRGLVEDSLLALDQFQLLTSHGLVVAEAGADDPIAARIGNLQRIEERRYGTVAIHLFSNPPFET